MTGLLPALGQGSGPTVQLLAGGLSGIVAMSALIGSGIVTVHQGPGPPTASLVVSDCMGRGVLAIARPGDQMLVTGRSADGAWLRVYVPHPVNHDGWVPASSVELLSDDPLPVSDCGAAGSGDPTETPTPSRTASATTPPTPTATTTATLSPAATRNPGPSISGGIDLPLSSTATYLLTTCGPFSIPWRYLIGDPDGVSGATLTYAITRAGAPSLQGTVTLNRLVGTSDWTASSIPPASPRRYYGMNAVAWTVTATDPVGAQTTTGSQQATVELRRCAE